MSFNIERLRAARKSSGLPLKEVAARMGVSLPQVQRLEKGQRRMTVEALESYCAAVELDIIDLLRVPPMVPIIGVIDANSEVHPLTPNTPHVTRAPYIVPNPERLAAIRWEPKGHISLMHGHLVFFLADVEGMPDNAWNNRSLIRRADGSQRIGWPVREGGQVHINDVNADVEFNVQIEWASPILAVSPSILVSEI